MALKVKKTELVKRNIGEGKDRRVVHVTVERKGKEHHIDIQPRDALDEDRFRRILGSFDRQIAEQELMDKENDADIKRKMKPLEGIEIDGFAHDQRVFVPYVTREEQKEAHKHHVKTGGEKEND